MITRIQALNYRCLRHLDVRLGGFHVLVGKNASGKSTFLDVIAFLGRLVSDGLDAAVEERGSSFYDLTWGRRGARIELAVEAPIPREFATEHLPAECEQVRYAIAVEVDEQSNAMTVAAEHLEFTEVWRPAAADRVSEGAALRAPEPMVRRDAGLGSIISRRWADSGELFVEPARRKYHPPAYQMRWQRGRSALGGVPDDASDFPITLWFRGVLTRGSETLRLGGDAVRRPSPPGQGTQFRPDGSNLPWVVESLRTRDPSTFRDWIAHVRTALPELQDIVTVDRPEDRHRYLVLKQANGIDIPSWLASDGTLRLLALTLLAYADSGNAIHLVEEPENGIHPLAIETVFQSLASCYGSQVLVATHSPVVVGIAEPEQILCFSRGDDGSAQVILGSEHPSLRNWRREVDLGTLFGSGVL